MRFGKNVLSVILLVNVLCSSLPVYARDAIDAAKTGEAPLIDGKLDEQCWEKAKAYDSFKKTNTNETPQNKTSIRVLYDDKGIYLGARCDEPDVSRIRKAKLPKDGPISQNDCIELMLDPAGTENDYFHFITDARGNQFDRNCTQGGVVGDKHWNAEWKAAAYTGKDFWSCEMFIPFFCLGLSPEVGPDWRINVCREKKYPPENSAIASGGKFNIAGNFIDLRGLNADFSKYSYNIGIPRLKKTVDNKKLDIEVDVPITNNTGKDASVYLGCFLISPSGKTFVQSHKTELKSGKGYKDCNAGKFSLTEQGKYDCIICLSSPDTKQPLALANSKVQIKYVPMSLSLISPCYRDMIFVSQKLKKIITKININLSKEKLEELSLDVILRQKGKSERVLADKKIKKLNKSNLIEFDNSKLPDGQLEIIAELKDKSGKTIPFGKVCKTIRKLPFKKGEVWRDKNGNWRIEDKPIPFLQMGFECDNYDFVSPQYTATMLRRQVNDKVKLVSTILFSKGARKHRKKHTLQKENFPEEVLEDYLKEVRKDKDNPNLFAYYLIDEPGGEAINAKALERVYTAIKNEDPYHPVITSPASNTAIKNYWNCADINLGHTHPHVSKENPYKDAPKMINFLRACVRLNKEMPTKQTLFFMDGAFCWGDLGHPNQRMANYKEYRNMHLIPLIFGSRGIIYYVYYRNHYPENGIGIPYLAKELAYLGEVALAPNSKLKAGTSSKKVDTLIKDFKNDIFIFVLNADSSGREISVSVPGMNPNIKQFNIVSEGHTVKVENGTFKDKFSPYDVHVYTTASQPKDLALKEDIVKEIDEANSKRRKAGNLAFQEFSEGNVKVKVSSFNSPFNYQTPVFLWHLVDGFVETSPDGRNIMIWKDGTPGKSPDWVELQLPEKKKIGRVVIYPFNKSLKDYEIQAFVNGKWQRVDSALGKKENELSHSFPPVETDRVRVWITGTNGPNAIISEIELYEK